jgi:hypothetical protein
MKQRCYNQNCDSYYLYGDQGVTVCARWLTSFAAFLEDMGPQPSPEHSVDRIDNEGNYEPDNCRWASPQEQMDNSRRSTMLTYNGETLSIRGWAKKLGITHCTITGRLKYGWPLEKVLTTPATPPKERQAMLITCNGETLSIRGWARQLGVHHEALRRRLAKGWTMEQIVEHFGS